MCLCPYLLRECIQPCPCIPLIYQTSFSQNKDRKAENIMLKLMFLRTGRNTFFFFSFMAGAIGKGEKKNIITLDLQYKFEGVLLQFLYCLTRVNR